MRKILCISLVFCMLFSLASCKNNNSNYETSETSKITLPEQMPDNFAISFNSWINPNQKDIFDTYEGLIQKDLVDAGVAKSEYKITNELRESIYKKIRELSVYSIEKRMTASNLATIEQAQYITPCREYLIKFKVGNVEFAITGDESAKFYNQTNKDASSFLEFIKYINELCQSTDEYKKLPPSKGSYI